LTAGQMGHRSKELGPMAHRSRGSMGRGSEDE
jgi:hypothetical protein